MKRGKGAEAEDELWCCITQDYYSHSLNVIRVTALVILPSHDFIPRRTNPDICHKDHFKCDTRYDIDSVPHDLDPYIGPKEDVRAAHIVLYTLGPELADHIFGSGSGTRMDKAD